MRATRSRPFSALFVISLTAIALLPFACGGSQPPVANAEAARAPEPEPAPAPDAAPNDEPAAAGEADSGWEGEDEALGDTAGDSGNGASDTRSMGVIQKVVMDNRAKVRACYERALKDNPGLRGDMTIHFVLDPEGKVKKAELNTERSTLRAPDVVACAVEELEKMPFPPSSRGMETSVNYPFNLNP